MRQQKTYVLKLWNDSADAEHWRASLEDIQNDDKVYFANLEKLIEKLTSVTHTAETETPKAQ